MELEVAALAPFPVSVEVARVKRGPGLLTKDDLPDYKAQALIAAKTLFSLKPRLVFYGCTAAGFLNGPEKDSVFTAELSTLFEVPVLSTAQAMVKTLQTEGAAMVDVVSPYSMEVNDSLIAFLADSGISVTRLTRLEAADVVALGRLTSEDVYAAAAQTPSAKSQALFIACSQLPTATILTQLRKKLGIPVWSSIAATAAQGFKLVEGNAGSGSLN
jgi:maleate cis-trans isomerase